LCRSATKGNAYLTVPQTTTLGKAWSETTDVAETELCSFHFKAKLREEQTSCVSTSVALYAERLKHVNSNETCHVPLKIWQPDINDMVSSAVVLRARYHSVW
jgi:hypothetical protein